jgi:uncharacterized damage-inducible protein DinB
MNQTLIKHLDPAAWRAKPPGKARTSAAVFTHMHNVSSNWVRLTAPHLKVPPQLNRAHCTPQQARAGLAESSARCAEMLAEALGGFGGRVEKFRRNGWAPPWPVGPEMLCYMLSHEAHHRGQVCMLAHQLGFRCPTRWRAGSGIGKSCGKSAGRLAAPATILKESLKGTGRPGMGCNGGDSSPAAGGCCESSGQRQRSDGGARIPRVVAPCLLPSNRRGVARSCKLWHFCKR